MRIEELVAISYWLTLLGAVLALTVLCIYTTGKLMVGCTRKTRSTSETHYQIGAETASGHYVRHDPDPVLELTNRNIV